LTLCRESGKLGLFKGEEPVRKVAMAFALATMPAAAWAADWRVASGVSETPAGRALGFIDAESIQRTGDRITFIAFLIYEPDRRGFDNVIVHFEGDCVNLTFESTQVSSYRGHRRVGNVGPVERGRAAPNSAGFGLIEAACGAMLLGPKRILDPYDFTRRNVRTGWTR
jgi:hypothetical protein